MDFYNDPFFKIAKDQLNKALSNEVKLFKFLYPREIDILEFVVGNKVGIYVSGGYPDAEYKRAIIGNVSFSFEDLRITILKINYNKRYLTLTHRNVLGTVLSLGIKRDSIGDILIGDESYIITTNEIAKFLLSELKVINNQSVSLEVVKEIKIEEKEERLEKIFVQSLRLDLIISKAYNIPRSLSLEMIKKELIKVNHKVNMNPTYQIKELDTISVRGYGRLIIKGIGGKTKSDNTCLIISKLR